MIRIEQEKNGKVIIETGLIRVEIIEDVKWKSNKRTDGINFSCINGSEIEKNRTSGNYAGEIKVTRLLNK